MRRAWLCGFALVLAAACLPQQGSKGDPGPEGAPGPQGRDGLDGDAGPAGPPGAFTGFYDGGGTFTGNVEIGGTVTALDGGTVNAPGLLPAGLIMAYGGPTAPPGWLLCDGSAVSRMAFAPLFAAIGTNWGSGDGTATFNLPDLRGRFLRGTDRGTARDPGAGARTASADGGSTGDAVGSLETSQLGSHTHTVTDPGHAHAQNVTTFSAVCAGSGIPFADLFSDAGSNACAVPQGVASGANTTGVTVQNAGGGETRPLNVNVEYIIKM